MVHSQDHVDCHPSRVLSIKNIGLWRRSRSWIRGGAEEHTLHDLGKVLEPGIRGMPACSWNYDAINRWLGLVRSHKTSTEELIKIFGDSDAVDEALRLYDEEPEGALREGLMLEVYIAQLREHASHIVPFCIKAKKKDRTSHYLIHCCNHGVPFKMMKDVMANAARRLDLLALMQPRHKPQPLVHLVTLPPRHFASPAKTEKCYLWPGRNEVLPLCQEGHRLSCRPSLLRGAGFQGLTAGRMSSGTNSRCALNSTGSA